MPIGTIDTPRAARPLSPARWRSPAGQSTTVASPTSGIYRSPVAGEPADAERSRLLRHGDDDRRRQARHRCRVPACIPASSSAGWGFMILSNMLPNGGNGTFTLHAVARSQSGETQSIGTRVIVADNAASTLPFGTIDTPGQGAIVSGAVDELRLGAHAAAENDSARRLDDRRLHRRRDGRPSVVQPLPCPTSRGCSPDTPTRTARSASTSSTRPA